MKTVSETKLSHWQTFENDGINHQNTVFGGFLLAYIDKYGGKCANKFCNGPITTVRLTLEFLKPVFPGNKIRFDSHVNYSKKSIIEVEVNAYDENEDLLLKGYLYFAFLQEEGGIQQVPSLKLETDIDHLNEKKAEARIRSQKLLKTELRKLRQ